MAKDPLASSEAILRATRQSQRLAEQMAGSQALLAMERMFFVRDEQIAALTRTAVPDLGLQGAAFQASQRLGEALAAQERRTRTMIELPRIAAEPRMTGLAAAEAVLDSNNAVFLRSAEMVSALVEGSAALRHLSWPAGSGFQATLEAARLSQDRLNNIVERLATATIVDLEPGEAQGVASAFEEAVTAATSDIEDFSERMLQAVLARLPAQKLGGPSISLLINLIMLLLALAALYQDRQGGKADAKNTEEITSRQDEGNDLLRRSLEEWRKCSADSLLRVRSVDREVHVFKRPARGAAVLAVVPEGVQVVVLDVWGRWAKVTYLDAEAEVRRTGWVLKKYLE